MWKHRRWATALHLVTIGVVAVQIAPATPVHASVLLSLPDAIRKSVESSTELKDLQVNQLQQMDMELAQAYQALRNQDEKDNSNKAKEHSMSRDIELGLKVPTAMLNKKKVQHQLDDKTRQTQVQTEQAYMTAYLSQLATDQAQAAVDKAEKKAKELHTKQPFGYATADEVKAADQQVEQAQSGSQTAQLAFKSSRLALGQVIGLDLDGDYRFELPRVYANLNQDAMWKLYESAKQSDYNLFQDNEALGLAQTKSAVIRGLYLNKFGSQATNLLAAMYDKPNAPDYQSFMTQYNDLIAQLKNRWKGKALVLTLSFPFLKIVPKVELQGEYQDDRYFEDLSTSLPLALLDVDKAKLKADDTRNKLAAKIKQSYLNAKQAEEVYLLALKTEATMKKATVEAVQKQKYGQMTPEDVEKQQGAYAQAQLATVTSYTAYKQALSNLNLASGGALPYISGIPQVAPTESGNEPFEAEKPAPKPLGTWLLEPLANGMTSTFTLKLADGSPATHYALRFKKDGTLIGEKQPITGTITHLNLVFQDPSALQLVLYAGDKQLSIADLAGYAPTGSLTETP